MSKEIGHQAHNQGSPTHKAHRIEITVPKGGLTVKKNLENQNTSCLAKKISMRIIS